MVSIQSSSSGVVQGNLVGTDLGGARGIAGMDGDEIGIGVSASGAVLIGGTDPNAPNVIAGLDIGIGLNSATATIHGNFIGVDAAQAGVISGGSVGIKIPGLPVGSTIGGTGPGEGNVIGGFDYGIFLDARAAPIYGNFIGTDTTATKNFGNRIMGIFLSTHSQVVGGVGPGEGNVIAFNGWVGILVTDFAQMNPIRGNRIFNNGIGGVDSNGVGLAIDLGNSSTPAGQNPNDLGDADSGTTQFGNDFQNYPLITSAVPEGGGTRVIGTLNSLASTVFDLDFYSNPSCRARPRALLQAETYIGSTQVTTDGSGNASFNVLLATPIAAGAPVTASATNPDAHTSELWQEIIFRSVPGVGGPGDTGQQSVLGHLFDPAATMTIGGSPVPVTFNNDRKLDFVGPSLSPGGVYDIVVTNPGGLSGTLRNGYVSRFSDIAHTFLFDKQIARLVADGVTAGVRRRELRPDSERDAAADGRLRPEGEARNLLRAAGVLGRLPRRSVQLQLRAVDRTDRGRRHHRRLRRRQLLPAQSRPPRPDGGLPAQGQVRIDVHVLRPARESSTTSPVRRPFADWIEQLAADEITGGCGGSNYCPLSIVNRGQMAAFLVKGSPSIDREHDGRSPARGGSLEKEMRHASHGTRARRLVRSRPSALGNTYTVTTTADAGAGSLRQAIPDANANPGADTIAFNIVGAGPHTITLASALPDITGAVTIDGYTQSGASPNTRPVGQGLNTVLQIVVDGAVRERLPRVDRRATSRSGGSSSTAAPRRPSRSPAPVTNNVVEGNFLGTMAGRRDAAGRTATSRRGVHISGQTGARVGGTTSGGPQSHLRLQLQPGSARRGHGARRPGKPDRHEGLGPGDAASRRGRRAVGVVATVGDRPARRRAAARRAQRVRQAVSGDRGPGNRPRSRSRATSSALDVTGQRVIFEGRLRRRRGDRHQSRLGPADTADPREHHWRRLQAGIAVARAPPVDPRQLHRDGRDRDARPRHAARGASTCRARTGAIIGGIAPARATSSRTAAGPAARPRASPSTAERRRSAATRSTPRVRTSSATRPPTRRPRHRPRAVASTDGVTPNDPGDGGHGGQRPAELPAPDVGGARRPQGSGTHVTGRSTAPPRRRSTSTSTRSATCVPQDLLEGRTYIGSIQVTTDGSGNVAFDVVLPDDDRRRRAR